MRIAHHADREERTIHTTTPHTSQGDDWIGWQANFPSVSEVTYLNTSSHGLQSLAVRESMERYLQSWRVEAPWETEWRELLDETLERTATLLGARPNDLAVMPTVTVALQGVLSALEPSDRRRQIVLGEREWISSYHVIRADGRFEPIIVPAGVPADSEAFASFVTNRTLLVVASHVCYQTGARIDLARFARTAHDAGAFAFADLFQSAGTLSIALASDRVDFAATGYLKFLLGTPGIACLYVRQDLHDRLRPRLSGWRGQRRPMEPELEYASGTARFTGGTWPIPSLYAAAASIQLILETGIEPIERRIRDLTSMFITECQARDFVVLTPEAPERRGAIVSVAVPNAAATATALKAERVLCSARAEGLRFSFHAYNDEADVARAIGTLERHLQPLAAMEET